MITELFLPALPLLSCRFAPLSPVSFKPVCFPWQHQMYLFPKRICDLDSLPLVRSPALAPSPGDIHPRAPQTSSMAAAPALLRAPRRGAARDGTGRPEAGIPTPASPNGEDCSSASSLDGSSLPLRTPAAVTRCASCRAGRSAILTTAGVLIPATGISCPPAPQQC